MDKRDKYYLVRERAVPEVLRKVVEVNKKLASGTEKTVGEAAKAAGISRSSYYKYAGDIEEFHDSLRGTTLTLSAEVQDETGILSELLAVIADCKANILTIHQSIPVRGYAAVSVSIQIRNETENSSEILSRLGSLRGVRSVRVVGR